MRAKKTVLLLQKHALVIATAESCTGGAIANALTDVPGVSAHFNAGFVAYANETKMRVLHVSPETLSRFGAVSEETAKAMARGALREGNAHIAVATTGIAGPSGGSKEKPLGTTWIAIATKDTVYAKRFLFKGRRRRVRAKATKKAFQLLEERLTDVHA